MTSRTRREWTLVGAVLVGIPLLLCGALVLAFVKIAGDVSAINPLDCPTADRQLAERMTTDGAAQDLLDTFPEGPYPNGGCDEDDHTVSVDVERKTGVPRKVALKAGVEALEWNGWRDLGRCYVKNIDGRKVWANLTYRDEYRSDPDSDLLLSMVSVRYYAC